MDNVLAWIFPEFFITSLGISRRRLGLIVGATLTFTAAVAVVCLFLLGKEEQTARQSATKFASALVHDKPAAAPPGATEYVHGVRRYFGPVTSARVVGAHNKGINTGDNADTRSFFVVQMLVESRRGPAVLELEYDNHALMSEKVSRIYELTPDHAPGLSAAQRKRLESAFAERGGEPADAGELNPVTAPPTTAQIHLAPVPKPKAPKLHIAPPASTPQGAQLRCVQAAHGDVVKMQKCVAG
jgi:hypothetical protein